MTKNRFADLEAAEPAKGLSLRFGLDHSAGSGVLYIDNQLDLPGRVSAPAGIHAAIKESG